jgi:hypothetical protein
MFRWLAGLLIAAEHCREHSSSPKTLQGWISRTSFFSRRLFPPERHGKGLNPAGCLLWRLSLLAKGGRDLELDVVPKRRR